MQSRSNDQHYLGNSYLYSEQFRYPMNTKKLSPNTFDCPLLVGVSRKSLIQNLLNVSPDDALNGTTALHMLCLNNGANILRVHDVKEALECIKITTFAKNNC